MSEKKQYMIKQDEEDRKSMDKKWGALMVKVKSNHPNFVEPTVPYKSN